MELNLHLRNIQEWGFFGINVLININQFLKNGLIAINISLISVVKYFC